MPKFDRIRSVPFEYLPKRHAGYNWIPRRQRGAKCNTFFCKPEAVAQLKFFVGHVPFTRGLLIVYGDQRIVRYAIGGENVFFFFKTNPKTCTMKDTQTPTMIEDMVHHQCDRFVREIGRFSDRWTWLSEIFRGILHWITSVAPRRFASTAGLTNGVNRVNTGGAIFFKFFFFGEVIQIHVPRYEKMYGIKRRPGGQVI